MNFTIFIRLLCLSAMWGASFLLMRVAVPKFGPIPLIFIRVACAAACFAPFVLTRENRELMLRRKGDLLIVGILNSAIPFSLLAFSTISLEAGFVSLLNATTPLFTAIIGAAFFSSPLRGMQITGLFMGFAGVAVLAWDRLSFKPGGTGWAILAALTAGICYGSMANYSRRRLAGVKPTIITAGSLVGATVVLAPLGLKQWPDTMPPLSAWACVAGLSVVCTAIAYVQFFTLIERAGAVVASTVTFLVPVFAIIWGAWLLREQVTSQMIVGMAVTLFGTTLTTGLFDTIMGARHKNALRQKSELESQTRDAESRGR